MRRPHGCKLTLMRVKDVGEYFARLAELEDVSSEAFRILAGELESHGAPAALVRAAKRASRDEERHAQMTSSIARRYAGSVTKQPVRRVELRTLDEIAIENAIEGCVRETYLSLVTARQAETAQDTVIRAAFKSIARDESDHATLAWTLAAWFEPRLEPESREKYKQAAKYAVQDLRTEAYNPFPEQLRKVAGLLAVRDALALIDGLDRSMWQKRLLGPT